MVLQVEYHTVLSILDVITASLADQLCRLNQKGEIALPIVLLSFFKSVHLLPTVKTTKKRFLKDTGVCFLWEMSPAGLFPSPLAEWQKLAGALGGRLLRVSARAPCRTQPS